jgi:hypothetical protein
MRNIKIFSIFIVILFIFSGCAPNDFEEPDAEPSSIYGAAIYGSSIYEKNDSSLDARDGLHILEDGEKVDAEQLNENFSYLDKTKTPRLYKTYAEIDKKRQVIGFSSITYNFSGPSVLLYHHDDFEPINLLKDGRISSDDIIHSKNRRFVFFCASMPTGFLFKPLKGKIFADQFDRLYYYLPQAELGDLSEYDGIYIEVFENVPAITGISEYPFPTFPTPIEFEGIEQVPLIIKVF